MTTATRKAETLKPAILTAAEVRAFQAAGAATFLGRNGDRVRVRYGTAYRTFKQQGGMWEAK